MAFGFAFRGIDCWVPRWNDQVCTGSDDRRPAYGLHKNSEGQRLEGKSGHLFPCMAERLSATLDFATCMLTEATLSFLGFGVPAPQPT